MLSLGLGATVVCSPSTVVPGELVDFGWGATVVAAVSDAVTTSVPLTVVPTTLPFVVEGLGTVA